MLSRTYQLSSAAGGHGPGMDSDPTRRLRGRMNRRRLDAECIRDTMLHVSGQLDLTMGGATLQPDLSADYGAQYTGTRRSVYVPAYRNALPEVFEVFDFADPSMVTGRRNESTVAPQALFLMNHPFVRGQSLIAARRLLAMDFGPEPGARTSRLDHAYRMTLGRPPTDGERKLMLDYLSEDPSGSAAHDSEALEAAWADAVQAMFGSLDFRYLD
jgi:hypothetical protein